MKRLILLFVAFVMLLSSCMTIGRVERNCDKFAKICVTERETVISYRDTTIYRVDTVEIKLPPDTVKISEVVQVQNNEANFPKQHRKFGLIGVDFGIKRSVLSIDAYLNDSTILHPVNDTIFLERVIKEESSKEIVPVKYIPGFYKFTFWLFWVMLSALFFIFVIALKKYFK